MNSESGKKSAAEMRQSQRDMLMQAENVQRNVTITEQNWNALIHSQKMQIGTMGEILEKLDTLTTEEKLKADMERQLQTLQENGQASLEAMEQYRQTMVREAKNSTVMMKDTMKALERQAGNLNEKFGQAISREEERMKSTSKMLFWISLIPTAILVIWELTRHIWLLA